MSVYREEITGLMSKGTSPTYINITEQVREVMRILISHLLADQAAAFAGAAQ